LGKVTAALNKILSKKKSTFTVEDTSCQPKIIKRSAHNLSRKQISKNALKVLYRLKKQGYSAYLVGGGVRDLLLGLEPKDFDIVTDAKPEEVKKSFRNAILIGKRFRLVHVRFKGEVIEVATFRQGDTKAPAKQQESHHGLILRDNVYGTIDEDVWRRDFSINALYYNIKDFTIIDYAGGIDDLNHGILRIIGDAQERLREDPVRMLRAVRLAYKLGFRIDEHTLAPFPELAPLLTHISPARLLDESLKLFLSGFSVDIFAALRQHQLFVEIYPLTEATLLDKKRNHVVDVFLLQLFYHTDKRIAQGKSVNPAYLFAGLLWYPLLKKYYQFKSSGLREMPAFDAAMKEIISIQNRTTSIPKRFVATMRDIWFMQLQFEKRYGRRPYKLLYQPKFRAGYDFLLLRAEAEPSLESLANWWTDFYEGDEKMRKQLLNSIKKKQKRT